jgi:hypothetical protein
MTLAPIEQAERYVAEDERYIARQREIVAALKRKGRRWTALRTAQVSLQTLELAHQFRIAARDRLRTSSSQANEKGARSPSKSVAFGTEVARPAVPVDVKRGLTR